MRGCTSGLIRKGMARWYASIRALPPARDRLGITPRPARAAITPPRRAAVTGPALPQVLAVTGIWEAHLVPGAAGIGSNGLRAQRTPSSGSTRALLTGELRARVQGTSSTTSSLWRAAVPMLPTTCSGRLSRRERLKTTGSESAASSVVGHARYADNQLYLCPFCGRPSVPLSP